MREEGWGMTRVSLSFRERAGVRERRNKCLSTSDSPFLWCSRPGGVRRRDACTTRCFRPRTNLRPGLQRPLLAVQRPPPNVQQAELNVRRLSAESRGLAGHVYGLAGGEKLEPVPGAERDPRQPPHPDAGEMSRSAQVGLVGGLEVQLDNGLLDLRIAGREGKKLQPGPAGRAAYGCRAVSLQRPMVLVEKGDREQRPVVL